MRNFNRPPSYLARIREFEMMAADTKNLEMVGVLRRLVRAYREVALNEMGGSGRDGDFTPARLETRPIAVLRGAGPIRSRALTQSEYRR